MDTVKFVPMLVGLLLAVVMVGAVFVPVISSSTSRTITTEIENEGAGWLALGYNEGTDYSFTVGFDEGDNFTVGTQTGEYANMICYADPQRTLFVSGDYWYLLTNGETPSVHLFTENASVTNASGTLTILDGSETVYTGASPTWAYVPDANGVYGFFTEGGLNLEEGKPTVAVGSYAGVYAYNETVVALNGVSDFGLSMSGNYADGEVTWVIPSEPDTLNPSVIDLHPIDFDPISLGGGSGSGSVGLMAVIPVVPENPPEWIFEGASGHAGILGVNDGYTLSGNIVLPSGCYFSSDSELYPIENIGAIPGAGQSARAVIPESVISSEYATVVIPDSVISINTYALSDNSKLIGPLVLPENVSTVKTSVVKNSGFDSLVVMGEITTAYDTSFAESNIKEVLNLGSGEITTTSYGLTADSVQDHVTALGYIAPTLISETEIVPIDSPVAGLMQLLPLIAGIGALFLAVGTMIYTRF